MSVKNELAKLRKENAALEARISQEQTKRAEAEARANETPGATFNRALREAAGRTSS